MLIFTITTALFLRTIPLGEIDPIQSLQLQPSRTVINVSERKVYATRADNLRKIIWSLSGYFEKPAIWQLLPNCVLVRNIDVKSGLTCLTAEGKKIWEIKGKHANAFTAMLVLDGFVVFNEGGAEGGGAIPDAMRSYRADENRIISIDSRTGARLWSRLPRVIGNFLGRGPRSDTFLSVRMLGGSTAPVSRPTAFEVIEVSSKTGSITESWRVPVPKIVRDEAATQIGLRLDWNVKLRGRNIRIYGSVPGGAGHHVLWNLSGRASKVGHPK